MGFGNKIVIKRNENIISIRDFGRGIPLGKVEDCVSKINTGGKYDSEVFKKSVGLNGVGIKAVNALSEKFKIKSFRDKQEICLDFSKGDKKIFQKITSSNELNGTYVEFLADETIFKKYKYIDKFIEEQIMYYAYLNSGLTILFNGNKYKSQNGLKDLLEEKTKNYRVFYPPIHIKDEDIEIAITHSGNYGEEHTILL